MRALYIFPWSWRRPMIWQLILLGFLCGLLIMTLVSLGKLASESHFCGEAILSHVSRSIRSDRTIFTPSQNSYLHLISEVVFHYWMELFLTMVPFPFGGWVLFLPAEFRSAIKCEAVLPSIFSRNRTNLIQYVYTFTQPKKNQSTYLDWTEFVDCGFVEYS